MSEHIPFRCVVKTAGPDHNQPCPNPGTHEMENGEWLCDGCFQYVQDFHMVQQKDPDGALENADNMKDHLNVIHTRIQEVERQRGTSVVN